MSGRTTKMTSVWFHIRHQFWGNFMWSNQINPALRWSESKDATPPLLDTHTHTHPVIITSSLRVFEEVMPAALTQSAALSPTSLSVWYSCPPAARLCLIHHRFHWRHRVAHKTTAAAVKVVYSMKKWQHLHLDGSWSRCYRYHWPDVSIIMSYL